MPPQLLFIPPFMVTPYGRQPMPVLERDEERRRDGCSPANIIVALLSILGVIIIGSYFFSKDLNNWYHSRLTVKETIDYNIVPDDKIVPGGEGDKRLFNKLTDYTIFRTEVGKLSFLKNCNRLYYENKEGIQIMTFETKNTSLLVSNEQILKLTGKMASKKCSFDCRFIAFTTNIDNPSTNPELEKVYVSVMDVKKQIVHDVGRSKDQKEPIRYLKWSPAGDDFLFAQEGQLYYVEKAGEKPVLISNKEDNNQVHGVFDWMTEEEIFSTREASWWSTRGDKIAFASRELISDPAITITAFRAEDQYQIETPLVYEKVGCKKLPVYTLSVWDKASSVLKKMNVYFYEKAFHYLFAVSWIHLGDKEALAAVWTNRWQNHTFVTLCDFETAECSQINNEVYPPRTWHCQGSTVV